MKCPLVAALQCDSSKNTADIYCDLSAVSYFALYKRGLMCRAIKYNESCMLQCLSLLSKKIQQLAYRPVVYYLTERALSRQGIIY